jgi:hypothetical protein
MSAVTDAPHRLLLSHFPRSDQQVYRHYIRTSMRRMLYSFDDLGIFSQSGKEIVLTSWGDVLVSAWLNVELGGPDDDR